MVFGSLVKIGIPASKPRRSLSLFDLADTFLNCFFNLLRLNNLPGLGFHQASQP